jgi:hypothetical protein
MICFIIRGKLCVASPINLRLCGLPLKPVHVVLSRNGYYARIICDLKASCSFMAKPDNLSLVFNRTGQVFLFQLQLYNDT